MNDISGVNTVLISFTQNNTLNGIAQNMNIIGKKGYQRKIKYGLGIKFLKELPIKSTTKTYKKESKNKKGESLD